MGRRCCFDCRSQLSCPRFDNQTADHIACDDSSDATVWFAQCGKQTLEDVHSSVGLLSSGQQLSSPEEESGVKRTSQNSSSAQWSSLTDWQMTKMNLSNWPDGANRHGIPGLTEKQACALLARSYTARSSLDQTDTSKS